MKQKMTKTRAIRTKMKIKGRRTKGDKKGIDKGIENLKNEIKRRHR